MSKIFEALQQFNATTSDGRPWLPDFASISASAAAVEPEIAGLEQVPSLTISPGAESRLVVFTDNLSAGAEKFRIFASRLRQLQQRRAIKKLLISSSVKDEGKTVMATNAAMALAKLKQRVLLIDGDCHQPSVAKMLGVGSFVGLSEWWHSGEPIANYLRRIEGVPLWFLGPGRLFDQPLEMLQSPKLAELLNELGSSFDWVIIDSPPMAPVADSSVWSTLTDGTVLVARQGKTPMKVLEKVLDSVDESKLIGLVLNEASDPDRAYYSEYYSQRRSNESR